jgi:hypothetical protein
MEAQGIAGLSMPLEKKPLVDGKAAGYHTVSA